MKLHIWLSPLFLSVLLLAQLALPVGAAVQPPPGRVYRAPDDEPYEVHFNREIDFSVINRRYGSVYLYWGEGAEDYDAFAIAWDEEAFQAHVDAGETEFEMTGAYGLREESGQELTELWDAGLVTLPDAPKLLVHIRPRDYVTVYGVPDKEIVWNVQTSTSFEEAVRYQDTVTLLPSGENPYEDPTGVDFCVTWNREEYEAGMVRGAEIFPVSGTYGEPEWDALKGWVRAEGTAAATVVVAQKPDQPELYRDYYFEMSGENTPYVTHVTPQCAFETLLLPEERQLYPVGTTPSDQKGKRFSIRWDRAAYEAGLASGQDAFTLDGSYGPDTGWTMEEAALWEEGLIQVAPDVPAPKLEIRVIREEAYPFFIEVVYRGGDYMPQFHFPWVNGTEEVVCAISFDKKTWYEQTAYAEDSNRWNPDEEFPSIWSGWYDDDWEEITIPADGVFYAKIIPTGPALPGESDVYELKPTGEGGIWEMIPDDGGTGDHGGGGQGEHDRPGKEEPDVTSPDSETEPEPDQAPGKDPEPAQPTIPPSPSPSIPAPGPVATPEEPPALPFPALSEPPTAATPPTNPGSQPAPESSARVWSPVPAQPPVTAAPSVKPDAEQALDKPVPPENDAPAPDGKAAPRHIPGFVTAAAATTALILGGAIWFRLRGKRK